MKLKCSYFLSYLAIGLSLLVSAQAKTLTPETPTYAKSLNTTAALVMNWYGTQIEDTRYPIKPLFGDKHNIQKDGTYPENIKGISLNKADLVSTKNGVQFSVEGQLQFNKNGGIYQQSLNDKFQFAGEIPSEIAQLTSTSSTDVIGITDGSKLNDKSYYQSRGFTYAWLAYLNGVRQAGKWINLTNWKETINYQLSSADLNINGSVDTILSQQQKILGTGQYLLREIKVNPDDKNPLHQGVMIISIDFNGEQDGIPTVANIQQTIEYKIDDKGNWTIIRITEKHLLPNPQPWQKILC